MKELDRDGCGVRCVDLASALNLSKPSVHNMMDTFSELGIISKTSYGVAHFTDSGNDTARRYGHY
jgi:Mn-dependent DtxR family transcriptional regulator